MDPVSTITPVSYTEVLLMKAQSVRGEAFLQLLDVVDKAAKAHVQPLGHIGNSGANVDVYA